MSEVSTLELRASSDGIKAAKERLDEMAAASAKAEKAADRLAEQSAKAAERQAAAAEKAAQRQVAAAERAAARENEAWNNALQRSLAAADRKAEAAEKAAQRSIAAQEKAASREKEMWNDAINRAKARADREALGRDGVLPIRPSLQRIEGKLNEEKSGGGGFMAGAVGGGVALVAEKAFEGIIEKGREMIAASVEYESIIARLSGIAGGADEAKKSFKELEEVSDKTIFTEGQMAEAFIHMSQVGMEPSMREMKAFSNIASAFGAGIGDVAGAVSMASMGAFRGLRQFGIKAKEEADGLKVAFRGNTETIKNDAESIKNYLTKIGEVQFAGAAAAQLDTMGGAIKELDESWERLYRNIGQSVIGDIVKTSIGDAAWVVDKLGKAIEGLLYTMSKKPPGMSKDKKENLAGFISSAENWGKDDDDAEIRGILDGIEKSILSDADKKLKAYSDARNTLLDAMAKGTVANRYDLAAALDDLDRNYARDSGGDKKESKKAKKQTGPTFDSIMGKLEDENRKAFLKQVDAQLEASEREYNAVKDSLAKQEDATRASYEKRKTFLDNYSGPDQEELAKRNEAMWAEHLDKLAAQDHEKSAARVKTHDSMFLKFATAGDRYVAEEKTMIDEYQKALEDKAITEAEYEQLRAKVHAETNRKIREDNEQLVQNSLTNSATMFGNFAEAAKNMGGANSAAYKEMFAIQKAFGVASTTMSMAIGIGKAWDAGWPAGIPLALAAGAEGAKALAMVTATNYSGAYDAGGRIPSGSIGLVGERGPELIRGPADVTGRADTARMLAGNGGQQQQSGPNISITNAYDHGDALHAYMSSTRGEQVIVNHIKQNWRTIRAVSGTR
jgi:hypothetical protein